MADWLIVQHINRDNLNVEGEGRKIIRVPVFYTMRKMSFW